MQSIHYSTLHLHLTDPLVHPATLNVKPVIYRNS